jgi:hypothetical protein
MFSFFVVPLTLLSLLPLGPYWGVYGESKVRLHASQSANEYSICLVQDLLELNSNDVRLILDDYRATSIDVMMGMSETLSW